MEIIILFFAKIPPLFRSKDVRCGHMAILDVSSERVGVVAEQVDAEGAADGEELLGVNAGFVEEFLEGARGDADAVGEPLVGVALAAQLVADKVSYVYLHVAVCFCRRQAACVPRWLPNPYTDDRRQKEGEQSRLQSAVVGSTFKDRRNARLPASICMLSSLKSPI